MAKTVYTSSELSGRINILAVTDIERGEVVSVKGIVGVALNPIKTGKIGTLLIEGIISIEKVEAEMEMLVGSNVYLENSQATNIQGPLYLGKVVEDSDPGDETVRIKITTGDKVQIISLTQAEYDAFVDPDTDTLYVIVDFPVLLSAAVPQTGGGSLVELNFNKDMGAVPSITSGIRFRVNGTVIPVSGLALAGDPSKVTFIPGTPVEPGDTCKLSIDPNFLSGEDGTQYRGCSLVSVTNSVV